MSLKSLDSSTLSGSEANVFVTGSYFSRPLGWTVQTAPSPATIACGDSPTPGQGPTDTTTSFVSGSRRDRGRSPVVTSQMAPSPAATMAGLGPADMAAIGWPVWGSMRTRESSRDGEDGGRRGGGPVAASEQDGRDSGGCGDSDRRARTGQDKPAAREARGAEPERLARLPGRARRRSRSARPGPWLALGDNRVNRFGQLGPLLLKRRAGARWRGRTGWRRGAAV